MAADNGNTGCAPVGMREPGLETFGGAFASALFVQVHRVVGGAEAQPRAHVDGDAQAIEAFELLAPLSGLVPVQHAQEFIGAIAREHRLHLARQHERRGHGPRRQEAGVHHRELALDRHQRPRGKPSEQCVAILGGENGIERVVGMRLAVAGGDRQQMKIMIAEHGHGRVAQRDHFAQHGQRIGPAIDQVADEPQAVGVGRETDEVEQLAEFGVAALDIADCVERHLNVGIGSRC